MKNSFRHNWKKSDDKGIEICIKCKTTRLRISTSKIIYYSEEDEILRDEVPECIPHQLPKLRKKLERLEGRRERLINKYIINLESDIAKLQDKIKFLEGLT